MIVSELCCILRTRG